MQVKAAVKTQDIDFRSLSQSHRKLQVPEPPVSNFPDVTFPPVLLFPLTEISPLPAAHEYKQRKGQKLLAVHFSDSLGEVGRAGSFGKRSR